MSSTIATKPLYLAEQVSVAIDAIVKALVPNTDLEREAAAAFSSGNHTLVKRMASTHLDSYFCKAYAYLTSAPKLSPGTDNILGESARATAKHVAQTVLADLGRLLAEDERSATQKAIYESLTSSTTSDQSQAVEYFAEADAPKLESLYYQNLGNPFYKALWSLKLAESDSSSRSHLAVAAQAAAENAEMRTLSALSNSIADALQHLA